MRAIAQFERGGADAGALEASLDPDTDEETDALGLERGQVRVSFADMDLISYERDLATDSR